MGALILQLAPFLIPDAIKLIQAIAALRRAGVAEADVTALVAALSNSISALDADTINTLAGIPAPPPPK
jgi:hypothetical protein